MEIISTHMTSTSLVVVISDIIFTTKFCFSQSLMVQKGTANLNVTRKGYAKKFCSLFGQKAHKHNKSHYFTPKEEVYPYP